MGVRWSALAADDLERRELVFPPLPCLAVYRVKDDAVEISRIYHGTRTGLDNERRAVNRSFYSVRRAVIGSIRDPR